MVRKVRQRIVELPHQQVLTVIETSHFCFHGRDSSALVTLSLPIRALLRKSYLYDTGQQGVVIMTTPFSLYRAVLNFLNRS